VKWTPEILVNGPSLWVDATENVSDTSGLVDSITDRASGHVFNGTGVNRPSINTETLNSLPVLDFSGNQRLVSNQATTAYTYLNNGTPVWAFIVMQADVKNANFAVFGTGRGASATRGWSFNADNRSAVPRDEQATALVSNGTTSAPINNTSTVGYAPQGQYNLFSIFTDPNESPVADRSFMRRDGGNQIATNTSATSASSGAPAYTMHIGTFGDLSFPLEGQIAEIIIVQGTMPSLEQSKVEWYLADKWGLTLASGHPFESSDPVVTIDDIVALDDPYAYYKLDEASGNLADTSGNGHTLTASGTIAYEEPNIIDVAGAVDVSAGGNMVDGSAAGYVNDGALTFMAAVRPDAFTGSSHIIHLGDFANGSSRGIALTQESDRKLQVIGWSSGYKSVSTTNPVMVSGENILLHVVITTSNVSFYVDGVLLETLSGFNYNNLITSPRINIGSNKSTVNTAYYEGAIGHAAIFNAALTADQISRYANFVLSGPTIDTQPANSTVDENTTATFTVAATASSGTLSYQWQEDTGSGFADMSGETAATLDFTAVEADSGNLYRCVVTDGGGSLTSDSATLTVTSLAPTIDTQPADSTVNENTTATFTVAATASAGSLSYQWQDDTGAGFSNMVGETAATLDFTAVEADDGNLYRCVVTDSNGSINTSSATLTVTPLAPTIDTQPVSQSVAEFSDATFTVAATATAGALSYQWREDSVDMAGETSDTLTFTVALADNGNSYDVVVTDSNGSITSNAAVLTVTDASPTIDTQPSDVNVIEGNPASFTVAATGVSGALTYQWYDASDDSAISGETGTTLTVDTVLADNGNTYYVIVTDDSGSTQSSTVTLTVSEFVLNFTVDLDPETSVFQYSEKRFDVSEPGAVQYDWYVNGVLEQSSSRSWFRRAFTPAEEGAQVFARAFIESGAFGDSTTSTIVVLQSNIVDNTEQPTPSEKSTPVIKRFRSVDWSAQAAALEGEVVETEDYIFSGRTFTRRDRLRNPRKD
jgi:hypothetical protein